jgi:3-hydroxyisobutyrate dehydrogenase
MAMTPDPSLPRIAFLGLGLMGARMAARLLAAGFPLVVHNRTAAKARPLLEAGAQWAESPRAADRDAAVIVSMVADDRVSRGLWLGAEGALAAGSGAVAIESSTVSVEWVRELSDAARSAGSPLLDAPVTGSTPQAEAGQLKFLVGGEAPILELVRPVLAAMGSVILHVGPVASGARLKLINNFLVGVQGASLAEALAMVERCGLGPAAVEILLGGAAGSPMVKGLAARIAAGEPTVNFPLRLMAKDLDYARREARALGLDLRTAEAAQRVFETAVEQGDGDRDMSAVIAPLRRAWPRPTSS